MMRALICATGVLGSVPALAADSRLTFEPYNANRVYTVYIQPGRSALIQFEDDETVQQQPQSLLGMGDGLAWELGVRGNNVVFKPKQKNPDTNLIIVTNKRTYAFDLVTTPKGADPTYIMRFTYADTAAKKSAAEAAVELKRAEREAAAKADRIALNTDYFWRGDAELLKPTAAWDDGRFTRLVYDHAGELPVIFKVMPDGSEALINTNIDPEEKNTIVLQEVIRTARVRLGDQVIEVVNRNYKLPKFNNNGSSIPGVIRETKGGAK